MTVVRSIALLVVAAVFEIGGAWLVWQGVRQHRGWAWILGGVYDILGAVICLLGVVVGDHVRAPLPLTAANEHRTIKSYARK